MTCNDRPEPHTARDCQTPYRALRHLIGEDGTYTVEIEFGKLDGSTGRLTLPRATLAEPHKAKVRFIGAGAASRDDWPRVCNQLLDTSRLPTTVTTRQGGWHGDAFVTPYGNFGPPDKPDIALDCSDVSVRPARTAGGRSAYLKGLRPFLEASDYLVFAYLLGLAAPLASRLGRTEGFAVCFSQKSSTGKTLSVRLAQSLFDKSSETDLVNFGNSMGRAMDSLSSLGGLCVCFGDIKADLDHKSAAQKLQTLTFNAVGGVVRQRKGEPARPQPQFLIPFFSAERPVHQLFADAKIRFEDGEAVRLLDIMVPPRDQGGIFAGASEPSGELAKSLDVFLSQHHGVVFPWWIKQLAYVERGKLREHVERREQRFLGAIGKLLPLHARIAKHFALLSAVGNVAERAQVLPIRRHVVDAALGRLFEAYVLQLGRQDDEQSLRWRQLFDLFEDRVAIPEVTRGVAIPDHTAIKGFCRKENEVERIYVRRSSMEAIFAGTTLLDGLVLPQLARLGCIVRQHTDEWTIPVSQAGIPKRSRYYRLSADALRAAKEQLLKPTP